MKVAYLTFDDGPSGTYTPQFLEVLKEHHILATFFVVGNQVEQHPEIVQQIQQQGHTIANHSYSHDFNKVYSNPTAFINDIEQANNAIEQACGQRAKIIRFPGGSATAKGQFPAIKELLNQKGYTYVDWNASCGDGRSGYTGDQLDVYKRQVFFLLGILCVPQTGRWCLKGFQPLRRSILIWLPRWIP